jgi:hypothetical protein
LTSGSLMQASNATWPPRKLGVWRSHFQARSETEDPGGYANSNTSYLVRDPSDLTIGSPGAKFSISVGVNEIVTITTQTTGVPSVAPVLPASPGACTFPRSYQDDFDRVVEGQEAKYFQDMHGAFEAVKAKEASRGMVMRQMAVGEPIGFHGTDGPPLSVLGAQAISNDSHVSVEFLIETSTEGGGPLLIAAMGADASAAAVLGSHITNAQCGHCGVYFAVGGDGSWHVGPSATPTGAWNSGTLRNSPTVGIAGSWHMMALNVTAPDLVTGSVDGEPTFQIHVSAVGTTIAAPGWVGIATGSFDSPVQFDRFVAIH